MASVKSNFVISYKEAFFDEKDSTLGIVMEYADNGDLYQRIVEHKKAAIFFEESEIWRILIQLVKGLKALHDLKILHRDLKSANVFLQKDGSAKLGDLNVSKVARRGLGYTQTGTPYYASPEVWKDQPYDNKSDIWSLGCVLYEMITLRPPFRAENMEGLYNKVIKGQIHRIPERFSSDLDTIVRLLIQVQSENRPSCDQILKHPIIMKRIEYFKAYANDDETEDQALLKTIKIPKNLLFLSDKLPRPNYQKTTSSKAANNAKNYRSFSNGVDGEFSEETNHRDKNSLEEELKVKDEHQTPSHIVNRKLEPLKNKSKILKDEKETENNDKENRKEETENKENENTENNQSPADKAEEKKIEQILNKENSNLDSLKNYREPSPKRRLVLPSGIKYQLDGQRKELPQLNIISSNKRMDQAKPMHNLKVKYLNNNFRNQNSRINDLYKIYAPYLNSNQNNNAARFNQERVRVNPNMLYLKNLEKYYDKMQLKKRHIDGPEIKILPKRKLSPIKRKVIKVYC